MSVSRRLFTFGLGTFPLLQARTTLPQAPPEANSSAGTPAPPPAPKVFDPHELATIAAMTEIIIPTTDTPGAREAHVAEYLDLILSDSPEPVRTGFLEGLWWTDGYAQRSSGAPFKDLRAEDQLRLVSALHDSSDEGENTGRQFVHSLKVWTARIYYSTEVGEQELNKQGRVPAAYFGHCEPGGE